MAKMTRATGAVHAAILVLILTAVPVAAKQTIPEIVKKSKPSIVTIVAYDPAGEPIQLGTGFFIDSSGIIVTNRHVLEGATKAEAKTDSGEVLEIEQVVSEDAGADLIKVRVRIGDIDVKPLRMAGKLPSPGQRIIVIGSPYGLEKSVSDGIVSTIRQIEELGEVIQITAPISPGSSGSPVLDLDGRVVGIATVQLDGGQNLNFAVPGARISMLQVHDEMRLFTWTASTLTSAASRAAVDREWPVAAELFRRAATADPDYFDAHLGLGYASIEVGNEKGAFESFREAVRLRPDLPAAHAGIATAYARAGAWKEAIDSYREAIRLDARYADAHYGLGVAYLQSGDQQMALEEYRSLKALDSEMADRLLEQIYEPPQAAPEEAVADTVPAPGGGGN